MFQICVLSIHLLLIPHQKGGEGPRLDIAFILKFSHLKIHRIEYYVGGSNNCLSLLLLSTPLILLITVQWSKSTMVSRVSPLGHHRMKMLTRRLQVFGGKIAGWHIVTDTA